MSNIYIPTKARIKEIIEETPDIKTFRLVFPDKKDFIFLPGQFVELTVFGVGEAAFCVSSSPTKKEYIDCSVKRMGKVTSVLHELSAGDEVGIRGPYGNSFPIKEMKGKNLLFVGGGIGLAPLRSLLQYTLDNRADYNEITIINGARTSNDLVFKNEYKEWEKSPNTKLHLTIDCAEDSWTCMVGFVPAILLQMKLPCEKSVAITCGPPIMIKYVIQNLLKLGFCPEGIITTLERKMTCGLGKCGRCNIGHLYVCKDGPVFSYKQLQEIKSAEI